MGFVTLTEVGVDVARGVVAAVVVVVVVVLGSAAGVAEMDVSVFEVTSDSAIVIVDAPVTWNLQCSERRGNLYEVIEEKLKPGVPMSVAIPEDF